MSSRITFRMVHITPAMAADFLKRNTRNRPLAPRDVARYRRDLERGNWITTHQGVAFALDGTLIDGQHRLTAIAESGIGAEMPVFEGLSLDAIAVIDDNRNRGVRDRVAIIDREIPTISEIACIKALVRGAAATTPSRESQQEALAIYREHIGAARFACGLMVNGTGPQRRAGVTGCIARASYSVNHDVLRDFASVLVSGIVRTGHPEDASIILLRDHLATPGVAASAGSTAATMLFRKTSRTLDAFRKGQVLKKLYEVSADLFPLPARVDLAVAS